MSGIIEFLKQTAKDYDIDYKKVKDIWNNHPEPNEFYKNLESEMFSQAGFRGAKAGRALARALSSKLH